MLLACLRYYLLPYINLSGVDLRLSKIVGQRGRKGEDDGKGQARIFLRKCSKKEENANRNISGRSVIK